MNRLGRVSLISLCALGIALTWILPRIVLAIHAACAMGIASEFKGLNLIDEQRLKDLREEKGYEDFSVEHRIRDTGRIEDYLGIQSGIITTVFALIGLIVWCFPSVQASSVAVSDRDWAGTQFVGNEKNRAP